MNASELLSPEIASPAEAEPPAMQALRLQAALDQRTSELAAANKALEAFSYSVSHDLRAPVRAVKGFADLLRESIPQLDQTAEHALQRIEAAAERMYALIEALLALSRISQAELNRQAVNLSVVANEIVEGLAEKEPGREVEIAIEQNLVVQADPALLKCVLEDLLYNAWKFSSTRAVARIEVSRIAGTPTTIRVRDNGVGFQSALAGRLFAPFQRLHTAEEFPGVGIGLARAQRIVHRHGGRIWAESSPGVGAAFSFTLSG